MIEMSKQRVYVKNIKGLYLISQVNLALFYSSHSSRLNLFHFASVHLSLYILLVLTFFNFNAYLLDKSFCYNTGVLIYTIFLTFIGLIFRYFILHVHTLALLYLQSNNTNCFFTSSFILFKICFILRENKKFDWCLPFHFHDFYISNWAFTIFQIAQYSTTFDYGLFESFVAKNFET